jgi:LAO/AO transport system kinase
LNELWEAIEAHRQALTANGELALRRRNQMRGWMWSMVEARVLDALHQHPLVKQSAVTLEEAVLDGTTTPTLAAAALLRAFGIEP